jgi:hypothetical protein
MRPGIKMNNVRRWVLLSVLLTAGMSANAADDRPNIVFLLADDFRWDSFGHLSDFGLKTPNLDSLAGAGVRFSRSYNTSRMAVWRMTSGKVPTRTN